MEIIDNQDHLDTVLKSERAAVLYFTDGTCNVGEALAPKLQNLLYDKYPNFKMYTLAQSIHQDIFAKYQIFTVPSMLLIIDGKEYIRKSRNFGISELDKEFDRLYTLMF